MAFGIEGLEEGRSLALSGGGFRATLFHLGALWRLNELGYLRLLDRIASVSGGAILAAYLGLQWHRLTFKESIFHGGIATNFREVVVAPVRKFCTRNADVATIARTIVKPWRLNRIGNVLESIYRRWLFGEATLRDLPNKPLIILHSTNLFSGATFRFSYFPVQK